MSSILQQTLRGVCFDTGWCYAVFWKLKRQARSVLTWEDAFYGAKGDDTNATSIVSSLGQQVNPGLVNMEDPIALSVSKMSYHMYSVGEGIIGRIAFTNKHQWVFSSNDKGTTTDGGSTKKANLRMQPEKYPSGWDQQFAAGIKTIAVIAVPQGVVQLGSTRVIAEDLKLIGHVKALFGTLQNVPGAFLSDLVTEVQGGGVHAAYPMAVPAPQLSLARTPSLPTTFTRTPSSPASMNLSTAGVGRLPSILAAQQQILVHAHSMPSPSVLGFSGGVSYFQHSPCDHSVLESLSNPSFCTLQPLCTSAGSEDIRPIKMGTMPGVKHVSFTSGMKVNTPPETGVIRQFSLSSKASSGALSAATSSPFSPGVHSPYSTDSSVTGGKGVTVEEPDQLRFNTPPRTGVIRHLSLNSNASPIVLPAPIGAPCLQAVHSPYSVNYDGTGGKGDVEEFEQWKATPPPQTGIIRNLSLNSKASSVAIPAVTGAPFTRVVHSPYSSCSATVVEKGTKVEDFEQMKGNPPPRAGVIRHLSLSSKGSSVAIVPQAVHSPYIKSAVSGDKGIHAEISEKSAANQSPRAGITRQLSLNSKDSPIARHSTAGAPFLQTVHSPCSASSAATRNKGVNVPSVGESELFRAESKSAFRMESPRPVTGRQMLMAVESCEVKSLIDSPNTSGSITREDYTSMAGRTWLENTQSVACQKLPLKRTLGGVRLSAEESGGRSFPLDKRLCVEGLQPDNSRLSEISQHLDSCRSSTLHGKMRHIQTLKEVQQQDRYSRMADCAQLASGPLSNQLSIGGPQLDSSLPSGEISSLVDRPAIESNEGLARKLSLQSQHLGVVSIPKGVYQVHQSSSEPGVRNLLSCSNNSVIGGFPLSISCCTKQDLHDGRESGSVGAKVSSFPCEEITSKSSRLTVQISDLLDLAQRFDNADSESHKDFTSVNVDSHQAFSSALFDDYFESMQSLKPIFQSPDRPVGDSGPTEYSVHNLFTSELDDFDEFFASLSKGAEGKSGLSAQPESVSGTRSSSEVSGYLNSDSQDVTLKGEEKFTNLISSCSAPLRHVASAANQQVRGCIADEATPPAKEVTHLDKELLVDRFVNSRFHPELSLPRDGDADLSCQEMAALLHPASRQRETRKKGKKRRWPGKDGGLLRSKCRQKIQEQIQELRTIVPDGARCGIDTLLKRALEYASALQTVSENSGKGASSANVQIPAGVTGIGSTSEASTSFEVSWVVDIGTQERACPVLVESHSQPGQMLVEMMCQEHSIFLKIADVLKRLGFTILKGVMEARSNSIWAKFVIEGPPEIHRVQVLWPLLHLLGASRES
ncbi:hypothetical protein GOP47_0020591 [Adiantum capillus-veneris]|uniref:BHLH domain-containing protein n=1 Tax=Adiantum capillus-veneris TaxID=13818 RepID=A0A9D4U9E9_ADICA|nr:hypothetical protein GOP47_0020591 [Adiantum capillus-veneris]